MNARFQTLFVFISLLALLITACQIYLPVVRQDACPAADRGLAFLKARYNPALGLLNEAPVAAPHVYWLTNDNALAAYAFDRYGQAELSATVWAAVRRYGRDTNGLIEVIWGLPVEYPPHVETNIEVTPPPNEVDVIKQELRLDGDPMNDWAEYANLGFLGALNAYQQGRPAEAQTIYAQTLAKFDGTGFQDKAYNGKYATYKLALALYVGAKLNASIPQANQLRSTLLAMQNVQGGFITDYYSPSQPDGDANTETTSLALLALKESCR